MFKQKKMSKETIERKGTRKLKSPIFLVIGLAILIVLTIVIYYIFLNFKEIMRIEYDGYAISGKEITENLLGDNSEENKNLELVKVREQDKLYKKLNSYFIGENKKDEINLEYPIYINNNSTIYNLSQNMMLITDKFKELVGYPNLTATNGAIYNQSDLERMDNTEYFFLKNEENVYTSLKEIRINTVANEYIIPLNSSIYFDKESIRYYEVKDDKLIFKEIGDIDSNSRIQIGDKEVSYQELLTKLKILREEKKDNDIKEETIKEDTSKENEKKNEEIKKEENGNTSKQEEKVERKYIKPEVSCSSFVANVYTMNTNLNIKDPSGVIQGAIIFEIKKDGKVYLRKTYISSGNIEISGVEPNTSYEITGTYIYLNEQGQKVENTFYRGVVTTKGLQELKPITLSFENGEIYSKKIQIVKLKIVSDITEEAIKGIKRAEISIGNTNYEIKRDKLIQIVVGQETEIETSESLKSNQKVFYEIKFYDRQGNEMKVENNKGETRTAKQKPSVSIRILNQEVIHFTLGIKLNNKDKVELQNYRYVINKSNGDVIKEGGLKESDTEIFLSDLDPNQYYTIKIYGNYDVNANKGMKENQVMGESIFATQPLATLGYVNLEVEQQDMTTNSGKINVKLDEDKTDKRLIQILKKLKIQIIDRGKNNQVVETKENNVISEITIEGEELQLLKVGEKKELIYEYLDSNTKYEIKITAKVSLGETIEEVQTTYNLKEFITLKKASEVQMKNLFVTGDMIDFDVRIEDPDNASLTEKVRLELRDEKQNLVKIEYIDTNKEYIRKTYEKLELNKTYNLSFYADQYNEGSTDSTYKVNYMLKQLEIYTETGITGSIGLADLSRKATGKNLVDMSSKIKWYVYPNFNTGDHYGKEYNEETKILTLGGHGNYRRAVYDLEEYAGQTVTMSFKAKLVTEGSNGNSKNVYIQNKKTDGNQTRIEGLTTEEWKEYSYTMQLDDSGYLGFFAKGGNGIQIQELQIELGDKKTKYEEFMSKLQANILIDLEDKRNEISTNNYFVKIYKNGELVEETEYKELTDENKKLETQKSYLVETDQTYKIDLVVKINGREYILDSQNFETEDGREIKGIRNLEDWLELQPNGEYIVLNDIDLSGLKYQFGCANLPFKGKIDFNGHTLTRDTSWNNPVISINEGRIENIVFNVRMNNKVAINFFYGFISLNKGTIENIQINLIESISASNVYIFPFVDTNSGIINKFIFNYQEHLYGVGNVGFIYKNKGIISNGYAYGENMQIIYQNDQRYAGTISINNYSMIKNAYSLVSIDAPQNFGYLGHFAGWSDAKSKLENVYSVGLGENYNLKMDPNTFVANLNNIKNSYYINDQIFNTNASRKTTELALHDTTFQNQILNSENAFVVDELVQKGYYPQLDMPECMPNQEYIKLPEVKDEDLPDILSTEVLEQGTTKVKVKFRVHNPSAETITNIQVKNLTCNILSQNYEKGMSDVIAELNNPILCVSTYSVLSLTTKGAYGLPFTRTFKEKERIIDVELFREINSIEDWEKINKSPTENYKLMKDLDFANEGNNICITTTYTGKLDGDGHTIRNINIPTSRNGLIHTLSGELSNLYIRNLKIINNITGLNGLTRQVNGIVRDIHMIDVQIENNTVNSGDVYIGGITGQLYGQLINCTVQNIKINQNRKTRANILVGGVAGYTGNGTSIENSYVQNLELSVNNSKSSETGGIVGKANSTTIKNCYATGKIKANDKIGGIAGTSDNPTIQNCYSKVDIIGAGDYIGGITGTTTGTGNYQNNIALGNIYSSKKEANIRRLVGGFDTTAQANYGYENQLVNGYMSKEKLGVTELLSYDTLTKEEAYKNKLGWTAYDTSKVQDGIIPKLYKKDSNELLPNQEDIVLDENLELEISSIETEKVDVNTISIQVGIYNPKKIELIGLKIEDMDYKVNNITMQGEYAYMTIIALPTRYYDSYQISEIWYKTEGKESLKEISAKIEVQFYKELYSYEDWQSIEIGTYQNYRLMNDIDFAGKTDMKTNVTIGRLESEGSKHTLKNVTASFNDVGQGLIQTLQYSMKNIIFENINITNTKDYTGIIPYCNGDIENIDFRTVTIEGKSYTGCIANAIGKISNIEMSDINISGTVNVGGMVGKLYGNPIKKVVGSRININGTNQVGGIVGFGLYGDGSLLGSEISVQNSKISGLDYVGGVCGNASSMQHVEVYDTEVIGRTEVGGAAGRLMYGGGPFRMVNNIVKGSGSAIGGISGWGTAKRFEILNCQVYGLTVDSSYVGGVSGVRYTDMSYGIISNSTVESLGSNIGGALGGTLGYAGAAGKNYIVVDNVKIKGYSNVGGIYGKMLVDYVYNNYTNAEVIATSHNAGGIVGYLDNTGMTAVSKISKIQNNYMAGGKVKADYNVGGLIGDMAEDIIDLNETNKYYTGNYVQADIESFISHTTSLKIGGRSKENEKMLNTYVYKYSTINGQNPNISNEPFIPEEDYLIEEDLKQEATYKTKLGWETNYLYTTLANGKYPILNNANLPNQEGIDLPKDSEHIVNSETGISSLSLEEVSEQEQQMETTGLKEQNDNEKDNQEELQETFEYNGKKIETYETYSVITNADRSCVKREERLYVKDGKLYVIDGSLDMVTNNLIVDSYNGKEYETILGTDGKLYDLKDGIRYPENFRNEKIKTIGNNLHQAEKEITVTYEDGSKVTFNYQTGEVIEEQKVQNNTSLLNYLKEQLKTGNNLIENTTESYEENKTLMSKLQTTPIEKAMELKNEESINNTVEEQIENTTNSSNETSSITSNNRGSYITMYNSNKKEFEVYKEEEILDVKNEEVVSQNEKIEKNNLNEYYVQEARTEKETSGIVWVLLSITGAVIVLFILMYINKSKLR